MRPLAVLGFVLLMLFDFKFTNIPISKERAEKYDKLLQKDDELYTGDQYFSEKEICVKRSCVAPVETEDLPERFRFCKGKAGVRKYKGENSIVLIGFSCDMEESKNDIFNNIKTLKYDIAKKISTRSVTWLFIESSAWGNKECFMIAIKEDECYYHHGLIMHLEGRYCENYDIPDAGFWTYSGAEDWVVSPTPPIVDANKEEVIFRTHEELKRCSEIYGCTEGSCKTISMKFTKKSKEAVKITIKNSDEEDKKMLACVDKNKIVLKTPIKKNLVITESFRVGKNCTLLDEDEK